MPEYHLEPIAELKGHDETVWHAAWNPAAPLLATCSADKTIRIYGYSSKADSMTVHHIATIDTGHSKTVRSLAWNPNGKTLAAASFDTTVSMWEQGDGEDFTTNGASDVDESRSFRSAENWECVATIEGPESEIKGVAYSASGSFLATCSRDKSVWIWEVLPDNEYETISVLMSQHTQDVKCVTWNPQEEILASGSYDDTIKLYVDDPSDDWFDFATLAGHTSTVWALAFSPCGKYLASASDDLTVRIWTSEGVNRSKGSWQCVHILRGHTRAVYSISWSAGDKQTGVVGWLASTGRDGVINVWEIGEPDSPDSSFVSNTLIAQLPSSHGVADANTVSWCPRKGFENFLVSTGDDGAARVWRLSR